MNLSAGSNEKIAYSIIFISITLFLFLNYGSIDSFMFQHMAYMEEYSHLGHVSEKDPVLWYYPMGLSGFYLYGIMISNITDISIDKLFFFPLQLIPIFLLLLSIFRSLSKNTLLGTTLILILATFAWNTSFTYSPHGLGSVLFLLMVLLSIVYWRKGLSMHLTFFIAALLTLVSINFISYKSTLWAYTFLASTIFLCNLSRIKQKNEVSINRSPRNLLIISTIIMLFFNSFIYSSLIPFRRALDEEDLLSTGLQKFYMLFVKNLDDPLSIYGLYYSPPKVLTFVIGLRQVILALMVLSALYLIIRDRYLRNGSAFRTPELLVLSFVLVTIITMLLYNILGAFDIGTLTYAGLIALLYLFARSELKNLIYSFIFILIASNGLYHFIVVNDDLATKDGDYFDYMKPGIDWCLQYQDSKSPLKMEILTKGYYLREMIGKNLSTPHDVSYPQVFSPEDMLFIAQKSNNVSGNSLFIMNYLRSPFSIANWRIIRSLEKYDGIINANRNLNRIYHSSRRLNILCTN